MVQRVAVVTGANKGIGFALVKGLCERFNGEVYLTSRDVTRGENAVKELNKLGYFPRYHQLDVTNRNSIKKLHDFLKSKHGGIDILINNAAILFQKTSEEPLIVKAEQTIFVNYYCLAITCEILFPLLRPHGRVINLSSCLGHLSLIPSETIRQKFGDKNLTELKLNRLVNDFIKSVRRGTNEEDGWGSGPYIVSKVAVTALTFIHSRLYGSKGISINCYHPGYVGTDMTQHLGPRTIDQGAETGLYLALQAPHNLKGQFLWHDQSVISWYDPMPSDSGIENVLPPPPLIALPVEIEENGPNFTNDLLPDNISTVPSDDAASSEAHIEDAPSSSEIVSDMPPPPLPLDFNEEDLSLANDLLPSSLSNNVESNGITHTDDTPSPDEVGDVVPPPPLPLDFKEDDLALANDLLAAELQPSIHDSSEETLPSNSSPVINMKNSILKSSAVPQTAVLLD